MAKTHEISQPPLNTSLLGVVAAAMDYFGVSMPYPDLYVYSGHAFVINIHKEVCPSGPYCWDQSTVMRMLTNIGLEMTPLKSDYPMDTARHREDIVQQATVALDDGCLVSALWLDHQIVKSFDGKSFHLAEPWGEMDATRATLSVDAWQKLHGPPVCFYVLRPCESKSSQDSLRESLAFAIDLSMHPARFEWDGYRMSSGAYENWLNALNTDSFESHGHWWNATVWAENRQMAATFFDKEANGSSIYTELASGYQSVATHLSQAANVESIAAKKANVESAYQTEKKAVELLKLL